MKNNLLLNLLLLFGAIGSLHVYNYMHKDELTIERAIAPLEFLSNARHAIEKKEYHKSIDELEDAIMAMKIIEKYADSVAADHVEKAIKDLKLVEREIQTDSINVSDLNDTFFNALNSIAYANLTISEAKLEHGERYKAMNLLNASFREMLSSLRFATTEDQRHKEEKAIADVRKFLHDLKKSNYQHNIDHQYHLEYDSINEEVEELID